MLIVRFGDGASAFCWLEQRWLAPTDYQFTLSLVSPWLFPPSFFFLIISVLLICKLFIFFFFLSFFLSFILFYFLLTPPFFFFFFLTLCLSSSTLYHLSMRVLVMSIESNFVFEFIAWVMVIMLVHSICQKWIHVRTWLALLVVQESTTFKGMRESVCGLASQAFLSQVNWLLRVLTVRPWDPLSSLEPLPVLIKVPKQEGLVMY